MMRNVFVFVPNSLKSNKCGFLEGHHNQSDDCDAFYITNDTAVRDTARSSCFVGYIGSEPNRTKTNAVKAIHVDNATFKIALVNYPNLSSVNLVRITYDYKAFRRCDHLASDRVYGRHFKLLSELLRKSRRRRAENGHASAFVRSLTLVTAFLTHATGMFDLPKVVWSYSATLSLFYDDLTGCRWLCTEILKEKRVTPKIGNYVLSKAFDLCVGVALLRLLKDNEEFVVEFIEDIRETIIYNFRNLLLYLMGSPIGLKLNHAFNNSLGKFFFYHIALWRVFLIAMQPFLKHYFKFLVLPGLFGVSYQLAMLSDLISLATFHVYCIYAYAARLISLQLKGLWSLWRLFIGRKHNPLRNRVDSFHYSQHQLFIGTLGFTVLLFLLPTTAMYFTVFVIFRLGITLVEELLVRIRLLLARLPLYVIILWLFGLPGLSGPVCLKPKKRRDGTASFEASLETLPLWLCVKKFVPVPGKPGRGFTWGKIFTGVQL